MTKSAGRARLSPVLMVMCGCLVANPAYDEPSAGASASSTALAATSTGPTTTTTTTDAGTTTGDGSASATGATTTGPTTGPTTGETSGGTTDASTGAAQGPAVVGHYDPAQCLEPLWCFTPPDVWNGLAGEVRGAECFDAPLAPPFRVRRIDYTIAAVRDAPHVRFQVRSGDLSQVLYESESLGLPATAGAIEIDLPDQPVVEASRFCVGFVGGDMGSTIGLAADASAPPPPGQSHLGSSACGLPGLRDVTELAPEPRPFGAWCLGAEIDAP